MNEKEFLKDIYDVLMGNTDYITQKQFAEKYKDLDFECDFPELRIRSNNEEWLLLLQKTWSDGENLPS